MMQSKFNKILSEDKNSYQVKNLSKKIRQWRRVHYYLGLSVAFFIFISAFTGIILAWKKNIDILQSPTKTGETSELYNWLSLEHLATIASKSIKSKVKGEFIIDRMDVRPDKGIVKIIFSPGHWEVQVDGSNGRVLSISKRNSDLIEKIHDGSIVNDLFKLISMNLLGFAIILMLFSGLWLWYGPRVIRKIKHL